MASPKVLTALETLHKELEKLEPAIKHVETAQNVTRSVMEIPVMHVKLLKEIKESDILHKTELKNLFSSELSSITEENKKLAKTTTDIQQQVKAEQEALSLLKNTIQAFHDKVEGINFPERLDKVDSKTVAIMSAINLIQSRLDNFERSVFEKIQAVSENQESHFNKIISSIEENQQKQQSNIYKTWGLFVFAGIAILILYNIRFILRNL